MAGREIKWSGMGWPKPQVELWVDDGVGSGACRGQTTQAMPATANKQHPTAPAALTRPGK
jgi:hypothetical protein